VLYATVDYARSPVPHLGETSVARERKIGAAADLALVPLGRASPGAMDAVDQSLRVQFLAQPEEVAGW
jgi:hypothetical protein